MLINIVSMIYTLLAPIFKHYVFQAICAITTICLEITETIIVIYNPSISENPIALTIIINIFTIITFTYIAKNAIHNYKKKEKTK